MCVLACEVYHIHTGTGGGQKRHRMPSSGVIEDSELPCGCWHWTPGLCKSPQNSTLLSHFSAPYSPPFFPADFSILIDRKPTLSSLHPDVTGVRWHTAVPWWAVCPQTSFSKIFGPAEQEQQLQYLAICQRREFLCSASDRLYLEAWFSFFLGEVGVEGRWG